MDTLYRIRNMDKLQLSVLPATAIQQLKLLFAEREKPVKLLLIFETTKETEDYTPKAVYKTVQVVNSKTIRYLKNGFKKH